MHLVVKKQPNNLEVTFCDRNQLIQLSPIEYSSSPIFPVGNVDKSKLLLKNLKILFCFPHAPYSTIGKLIAKLNDERINSLWYSHGLASLIIINSNKRVVESIRKLISDELIGYELWNLKNNKLDHCHPNIPPKNCDFSFDTPDASKLSSDYKILLDEYLSQIKLAAYRANIYEPLHLKIFSSLHNEVCSIIDQLLFLTTDNKTSSYKISQQNLSELSNIKNSPSKKVAFIHTLTDQFLQINSILSYVITQCYAGVSPILHHECPIRYFSLLGVGTALKSLIKIYYSVSKIFEYYPIPRVIRDSYKNDFTPIPIFKNFSSYKTGEWQKYSSFLDGKIAGTQKNNQEQMFHLTYFSGQQGYRESLYGISAALQSLFIGSTTRWTILTISHEFLHAHVRAILSVLFPETKYNTILDLFNIYKNTNDSIADANNLNAQTRLSLIIIAVVHTMFEAKLLSENIQRGTNRKQPSLDLDFDNFLEEFKALYKEINEYIVHTLDYLYFYEANKEIYVKIIWLTWATNPHIQERISHYLLRSLLTISHDSMGLITDRFNYAKKQMLEIFDEIIDLKLSFDKAIIEDAKNYLNDPLKESSLRAEFTGCIRIADMAKYLLHSSYIHHDIKEDPLQVQDENDSLIYQINTLEFQDKDIKSPIAFIVDCVKKKLKQHKLENNYEQILRETCWELIVLASANLE